MIPWPLLEPRHTLLELVPCLATRKAIHAGQTRHKRGLLNGGDKWLQCYSSNVIVKMFRITASNGLYKNANVYFAI